MVFFKDLYRFDKYIEHFLCNTFIIRLNFRDHVARYKSSSTSGFSPVKPICVFFTVYLSIKKSKNIKLYKFLL
jgi:hypothetical protein